MTRYLIGTTFFVAIALGVCFSPRNIRAETSTRPNILVILADDLGYGDVACYGNRTIKTPHLDKLAQQGMRLTDCYAAAPVCSPSRAGMLTGRTPSRVGVYDWIPADHVMHLRNNEITVAALLKQAGYETCLVGKWHLSGKLNSPEQPQPNHHGFDYWFATQFSAEPTHRNPVNFFRNGEAVGLLRGFSCQLVANEAICWLKVIRDPGKPFLQFVCFHEPHEPIDSPTELIDQYPQATRHGEALYYANVTNMDLAAGSLMAALDELKLADNTLVLFTSDNGPEILNRHLFAWRSYGTAGPLRGVKWDVYEGGIRVPGIIRFPGHTKPGQVISEPVSGVDLLPTFCELAGVRPPADRSLDGASFMPIFSGRPVQRATPLYWHYYRTIGKPKAAMRVGDWMVLGHWDGPPLLTPGTLHRGHMEIIKAFGLTQFELYNLRNDPGQQRDLADNEPELLKKLSDMLVSKYNEVQAEGPVWDIAP